MQDSTIQVQTMLLFASLCNDIDVQPYNTKYTVPIEKMSTIRAIKHCLHLYIVSRITFSYIPDEYNL